MPEAIRSQSLLVLFCQRDEGKRGKHIKTAAGGIVSANSDWLMRADVRRQHSCSQHISITNFLTRHRVMVKLKKKCTF